MNGARVGRVIPFGRVGLSPRETRHIAAEWRRLHWLNEKARAKREAGIEPRRLRPLSAWQLLSASGLCLLVAVVILWALFRSLYEAMGVR